MVGRREGSRRTKNDGRGEVRCRVGAHVGALKRGPMELDGAGSGQGLSWRERRVGMSHELPRDPRAAQRKALRGLDPVPSTSQGQQPAHPSCPAWGPWLAHTGGFTTQGTCTCSIGGVGADVAQEMLAGASSDGRPPGGKGGRGKRRPPPVPGWRGWDEVQEKRCLLHGSDTHKMAAVGDPGWFRREGVGRWSRGGWGGGRAWGSALSWKQEMGEGREEHKLAAAGGERRHSDRRLPAGRLAEGRKRRGRKGGSKRGQDKQPQRRPAHVSSPQGSSWTRHHARSGTAVRRRCFPAPERSLS